MLNQDIFRDPGGKTKLRVGAQRQKAKESRSYVKELKENIW